MKSVTPRYPVDRYLVDSSKQLEMVNIIDDNLWNTEPALKPEDEIILRKLHDMLQSTADDLKLLSGELSKFHEPGVQVKSTPTPLDEEFNEKVHIEEIVNAKFHGYKIIDKLPSCMPEYKPRKDVTNFTKPTVNSQKNINNTINVPVNTRPIHRNPVTNRNLEITRTKIVQINGNENSKQTEKLNNSNVVNAPAVAYNEYSHKYVEPKLKTPRKALSIQEMPSISIRSELKEQKVLHLDIIPEAKESEKAQLVTKNVAVVAIEYEIPQPNVTVPTKQLPTKSHEVIARQPINQPATTRKISKMSTCDSSESTNNIISSDTQVKLKTQKRILANIKTSPNTTARNDRKKINQKKESEKRSQINLDEWRKKLNSVYGASSSKRGKSTKAKSKATISQEKSNKPQNTSCKPNKLDNLEYIPYSKLTVGGVRASDIEREISDIPNKKDIRLSPILDKILSSRENSFSKNSPEKHTPRDRLNVFTTSDENLLQEVIDIEKTVSETLSKNNRIANKDRKSQSNTSDSDGVKENDSYADDFEDENSDPSRQSKNYEENSNGDDKSSDKQNSIASKSESDINSGHDSKSDVFPGASNTNIQNLTRTKISNLSFKNTVDIFECVHSVNMQDSATQSNAGQKISLKETQTSPTNDRNIQPIHNDLWPTIDPKGEIEKMFEIEKGFIKKLIVEEYGDLLEKSIEKPSTSKEVKTRTNVAASQKTTQTSPSHVKNVMTSPTKTKTRTTSPFARLNVDSHTSPLIFVTNEDEFKLEIGNEDDPGISINLSSPKFSLRLPQTSREVLSNLGDSEPKAQRNSASNITNVRNRKKSNITVTSTSSLEADSSEMSSLGEVKLRRKLGNIRIVSDTESVTSLSSTSDFQSGILPLRSEGELSLGRHKKSNKQNKSEGEASFGLL